MFRQQQARLGGTDTYAGALEEHRPRLPFQRGDVLADSRRRVGHLPGRGGHRSGLHHGVQTAETTQIQHGANRTVATCGDNADIDAIIGVLRDAFEAERVDCRYLTRGVPPELETRRFEEFEPGSASHASYDM